MILIQWRSEFETGITKIDEQHKELIKIINDLHNAMLEGKGKSILDNLMERVIDYTFIHFATEEELMLRYKYTDSIDHLKKHKELREKAYEIKDNYLKGRIVLSANIMNFLRDWLITHILGTDIKFGEFLKKNGVK